MTSSTDLKFDEMEVDIKLAQDYIKKYNSEFYATGITKKERYIYDAGSNKIQYSDYCELSLPSKEKGSHNFCPNLILLANNIEKNIDLFCQLEFLIRQKPIQSTALELQMIIKHLHHLHFQFTSHVSKALVMKNDSPLIDLGWIGPLFPVVDILATENTAVVCHVFTKLCHISGIDTVNLFFIRNEDVKFVKDIGIAKNKALDGGCIGVVTAQSDVDSAVGAFLAAPRGGLWGIRRILVQESAVERLKTEFAWKTRSGTKADVDPQLKSLCTDLYVYDEKIFLREYVGKDTNLGDVVLIEPFRTVKELLTLIESFSPFCVSLWSHGVAESNEVAFGLTAPMVWVNRYGTIGYPNEVSLAYFSQVLVSTNDCNTNSEIEKVRKLQKTWLKLTSAERRSKALAGLNMSCNDLFKYYIQCFYDTEGETKNFAHVGASDLVIGNYKPRDIYAVQWKEDMKNAKDVIQRLLNGSGFLINISPGVNDIFKDFATCLAKVGLPVLVTESKFSPHSFPLEHTVRIIHSNFGTIFAN